LRQRIVAIVQARTGSTRLPGKVLLPILGEPMLVHVMRRTGRARLVDEVVLATTTLAEDDRLAALADDNGWPISRGSATDLLRRYADAARSARADAVVRITSDCPLIDPELIDATIDVFTKASADYASNALEPRTFPRGLDVEVVSRVALEAADRDDVDPASREHATPYIRRHPERFVQARLDAENDASDQRWTVDTPEDLELVRRIYSAVGNEPFGWRDALRVAKAHPDWSALNRHVVQKEVPALDSRATT
jgi:spore coat polysaccharide biosynthesis protein SpsF